MKTLIVEDEFTSRKILQNVLFAYGECHVAISGPEALDAFQSAHAEKNPYHLICLDIMLPGLNGQEILKKIRAYEAQQRIQGLDRVKVIMTTALSDRGAILGSFKEGCESYMIKPVSPEKLVAELQKLGLLE